MERPMLWSIYMCLTQRRTKCCIQSLLWHRHMNRSTKNRIGELSSFTDSKKPQNSFDVLLRRQTLTIGNHSKRESLAECQMQTAKVSLLLKQSWMIRKEQERLKVWRNRISLKINSTKKLPKTVRCRWIKAIKEFQENFRQSKQRHISKWNTSQEKF